MLSGVQNFNIKAFFEFPEQTSLTTGKWTALINIQFIIYFYHSASTTPRYPTH